VKKERRRPVATLAADEHPPARRLFRAMVLLFAVRRDGRFSQTVVRLRASQQMAASWAIKAAKLVVRGRRNTPAAQEAFWV